MHLAEAEGKDLTEEKNVFAMEIGGDVSDDDDVTPFYREAFDCFPCSHSGRISTYVRCFTYLISVLTGFQKH